MITVGGWIVFGVIALVVVGFTLAVVFSIDGAIPKIIAAVLCFVVLVGSIFALKWYFNDTEAGKRAVKDQLSNFEGGIERVVSVYDMEGELIMSYEGEFDVEMHDTYILFDDENGKRHIIYFTTGTVAVDEK